MVRDCFEYMTLSQIEGYRIIRGLKSNRLSEKFDVFDESYGKNNVMDNIPESANLFGTRDLSSACIYLEKLAEEEKS